MNPSKSSGSIRQRGLPPGTIDTSIARSSPLRIRALTPWVRIPKSVATALTDRRGSAIAAPFRTVGGAAGAFEKGSLDSLWVAEKRLAGPKTWYATGFGLIPKPADRHSQPAGDDVQRQKARG